MNKLRELRKNTKPFLTQEEFGKKFGISGATYKNYETENTQPPFDLLIKFADYYNVSLDELLNRKFGKVLTENEQEMLNMFRQINESKQSRVLGYLENIIAEQKNNKFYKTINS